MVHLLVADADAKVRSKIKKYADSEEFTVDEAADGIDAIKACRRKEYDLVILDAFLPELDGFNVCRQLRKASGVPVIFLTAKSGEYDRLEGFDSGADDYVLKPFYVSELFARIRALLNRCRDVQRRVLLTDEGICVNMNARSVTIDDAPMALSPREYDLLVFLMENPGRALSRAAILHGVWGDDFEGTDRTVDTHIRVLRDHLRPYENHIVTVWGIGYKYER